MEASPLSISCFIPHHPAPLHLLLLAFSVPFNTLYRPRPCASSSSPPFPRHFPLLTSCPHPNPLLSTVNPSPFLSLPLVFSFPITCMSACLIRSVPSIPSVTFLHPHTLFSLSTTLPIPTTVCSISTSLHSTSILSFSRFPSLLIQPASFPHFLPFTPIILQHYTHSPHSKFSPRSCHHPCRLPSYINPHPIPQASSRLHLPHRRSVLSPYRYIPHITFLHPHPLSRVFPLLSPSLPLSVRYQPLCVPPPSSSFSPFPSPLIQPAFFLHFLPDPLSPSCTSTHGPHSPLFPLLLSPPLPASFPVSTPQAIPPPSSRLHFLHHLSASFPHSVAFPLLSFLFLPPPTPPHSTLSPFSPHFCPCCCPLLLCISPFPIQLPSSSSLSSLSLYRSISLPPSPIPSIPPCHLPPSSSPLQSLPITVPIPTAFCPISIPLHSLFLSFSRSLHYSSSLFSFPVSFHSSLSSSDTYTPPVHTLCSSLLSPSLHFCLY